MSMRLVVCLVAATGLVGCGERGPELAQVTGKVTLDGAPVAAAAMTFRPMGNSGTTSYGGTNQDGDYTMAFTKDKVGVMPGEYFVDIETIKMKKRDIEDLKSQGLPEPPPYVAIPKKYRGADQLKATVKAGEKNVINFELDSK